MSKVRTIEKKIISRLVKDILKTNASISVYDGEAWALSRSRKYTEVMKSIMSTDEDQFRIRNLAGEVVGWVHLIYGNDGYDVISNYTANDYTESVVAGAYELADKMERGG